MKMIIPLKDLKLELYFGKSKGLSFGSRIKSEIIKDKTNYSKITSIRDLFKLYKSRDPNFKRNSFLWPRCVMRHMYPGP